MPRQVQVSGLDTECRPKMWAPCGKGRPQARETAAQEAPGVMWVSSWLGWFPQDEEMGNSLVYSNFWLILLLAFLFLYDNFNFVQFYEQ